MELYIIVLGFSLWLVHRLDMGGPTFCSWWANLNFNKYTGYRQKKKNYIITYLYFVLYNAQIITLHIKYLYLELID